jgi:hypothetical protein
VNGKLKPEQNRFAPPILAAGLVSKRRNSRHYIDILADAVFFPAIALLNFTFQLLSTTCDFVEIIVGEFTLLLLHLALNLLPIPFDAIPVHFDLLFSAADRFGNQRRFTGLVLYGCE